jgi:hypothetical protein
MNTTCNNLFNPNYNDFDVFLAKGHGVDQYPGVRSYRRLIDEYSQCYVDGTPIEKRIIANTIVNYIRVNGGRFFYIQNEGDHIWTKIPHKALMKKVKQALRDYAAHTMIGQDDNVGLQQYYHEMITMADIIDITLKDEPISQFDDPEISDEMKLFASAWL